MSDASTAHSAEDLSPAEALALQELVWLMTPGPKSHEAIAARLGISRQMVSVHQANALARLRKLMPRSTFEDFEDFIDQTSQTSHSNVVISARMLQRR